MIDRHARCIYMSGKISCFTSNHFLNYLIFFSFLTAQPASAHLLKNSWFWKKKQQSFGFAQLIGSRVPELEEKFFKLFVHLSGTQWSQRAKNGSDYVWNTRIQHTNKKKVCCLSSHSNSFSWVLEFLFVRLSGSFLIALNCRLKWNAQFNTP